MIRNGLISLPLLLGLLATTVPGQATSIASLDNRGEAERIWELVIKAKGGREKLHAINSIHGTSSRKMRTRFGKSYVVRTEFLSVLPDKDWSYWDHGNSVLGISQSMVNLETMTEYFATETKSSQVMRKYDDRQGLNKGHQNPTIYYLLESRWLKPVILGIQAGKVGNAAVHVIQTMYDGRRVDVAVDRISYLPVEITLYDVGSDGKTVYPATQRFEDYAEIDGIMTPRKVSVGRRMENITVRFNVDYDPMIFRSVPPLEPDAWKSKEKN